jgi:four helix bundle protein
MASYEKFEDLQVWQAARTLVREIYLCTQSGSFVKDMGLRTQIQRSAISVMSNIAEGFERSGNKEFSHFLYLAKGSAGEVRSQLYPALDLGYLDQKTFTLLNDSARSISKQLSGFIKYLNQTPPPKSAKAARAHAI